MADKAPATLKPPTACKPPVKDMPPAPPAQQEQDAVQCAQQDPVQPPSPAQVSNPVQPTHVQVQPGQPQLNWSYFKPEFSGKPEEDVEVHPLRTNDWIETHNFPEVTKVQRFCLTLTGEARLWYESLRPIIVNWTGLQEHYRQ